MLTLTGVRLPKRLERSLDTSALETPVKMISAFPVPGDGQRVRVVVAADGALDERAERVPRRPRLAPGGARGLKTEEVAVSNRDRRLHHRAGGDRRAELHRPDRATSGKKVSFEFKDIDIHNLLRVIAEV